MSPELGQGGFQLPVGGDPIMLQASMGLFFVKMIKDLASEDKATNEIKSDWRILSNWIGCNGRDLTKSDEETIMQGWVGYLTSGRSKSEATLAISKWPTIVSLRSQYAHLVPPQEVIDLFDGLTADPGSTRKPKADPNQVSLPITMKNYDSSSQSPSGFHLAEKLDWIEKRKWKVFIVFSVVWIIWTNFRTGHYQQLFAIELEPWRNDMQFVNAALPIVGVFAAYWLMKWMRKHD
jgi:hypothetical protein